MPVFADHDPAPVALSVVMPVYNAAPYLDASIRSILGQTFRDFELLVLDDASTDGSRQLLRAWARRDGRIRLLSAPAQLGLPTSADLVVRQARAAICARMDADDVSHPDRLLAQWKILARMPDVVLVGTQWQGIDARGQPVRPRDRWRLVRPSPYAPFPHGSIMFRREAFLAAGGYREACAFWEDLDLYYRLAAYGRIVVLPDVLYRYRFHADSSWTRSAPARLVRAADLMHRCVALHHAGQDYTDLLTAEVARPDELHVAGARALYSVGSGRLWAGHTPGILGLIRRLRIRSDGGMLKMLILAFGGEISPRLLRSMLRVLIRLLDCAADRAVTHGVPVEWRVRQQSAPAAGAERDLRRLRTAGDVAARRSRDSVVWRDANP